MTSDRDEHNSGLNDLVIFEDRWRECVVILRHLRYKSIVYHVPKVFRRFERDVYLNTNSIYQANSSKTPVGEYDSG